MIADIAVALLSLDFEWFLGLVFGNLFWVFAFFALGYFFFRGKNPLRAFIHVAFAVLFFNELLPFIGWKEYVGQFLLVYYLVDLSLLKIAESIPFFSSRLVWVEEANFFGSILLFNLFMV